MGEIERYEKCYMGFFSKHLSFIRFNGGKISASNDWDVVFKLKLMYKSKGANKHYKAYKKAKVLNTLLFGPLSLTCYFWVFSA